MKLDRNLTNWIYEHKVCWEIVPYFLLVGSKKVQVGFELYLYAQHADGTEANPGCEECQKLFHTLRDLAILSLPQEYRPTRYQIEPFDAGFHIRPETRMKTEVQLKMLVIHREDFLSPVDDCERKCATEIQRNLSDLGAQPKVWSQKRARRTL